MALFVGTRAVYSTRHVPRNSLEVENFEFEFFLFIIV